MLIASVLDAVGNRGFERSADILHLCTTTSSKNALAVYRTDTGEAIGVTPHQWNLLVGIKVDTVDNITGSPCLVPIVTNTGAYKPSLSFDETKPSIVPKYYNRVYGCWIPAHEVFPGIYIAPPKEPSHLVTPTVAAATSTTVAVAVTDPEATEQEETTSSSTTFAAVVAHQLEIAHQSETMMATNTIPTNVGNVTDSNPAKRDTSASSHITIATATQNLEAIMASFATKAETEAQLIAHLDLQADQLWQILPLIQDAVKGGNTRTRSLSASLMDSLLSSTTTFLKELGWLADNNTNELVFK